MNNSYYVDTCIYLNIWQKESIKGIELWRIAKEFFDKLEEREDTIYYSGFILKELSYILTDEEFNQKRELFNSNPIFIKEVLTKEEYEEARKIENELNNEISFYDIMHILISRKTNSILITRDKKLIEISKRLGVEAKKPEEIL
ncbi:MAG: PIN domain-containing protein [Nanoarchaeota archaeon]